jgi:hypothetical protein
MRDERMNLRRRRPWHRVPSECGECGAPKPPEALACADCLAAGAALVGDERPSLSQKHLPRVRRHAHGRPTRVPPPAPRQLAVLAPARGAR